MSISARELDAVARELDQRLGGFVVRDVARLAERDDLLLFLDQGDDRAALHIALGARRARICTTRRRFRRAQFATGPQIDRLSELLGGAVIETVRATRDERCARVELRHDERSITIDVELFGNRGLWIVSCDDVIEELSRLPNVDDRTLRRGVRYEPPKSPAHRREEPSRFAAPVTDSIDEHYTGADLEAERHAERHALDAALTRARKRAADKLRGLERQRAAMDGADALRTRADLLLAYGYGVEPGATELHAPDADGTTVVIPLRPGVPIHVQAESLYHKARKYADGRAHADRRIEAVRATVSDLDAILAKVAETPDDELGQLRIDLEARGLVPAKRTPKPAGTARDKRSRTQPEGFRRFTSAEGLPIFVGRNNQQNDRLSIRFAKGNDLWFHVGRGYAGSHVVVRLDKHREANRETILDAATLAVYYSKVRGAELCEVIHTQAKHVSKPKGLPPGKVLATQTKELRLRLEPDRLRRLLGAKTE